MKAFIDDFKLIRIETNQYIHDIGIEGYQLYWDKNEGINQYFKVNKALDLHKVDRIWINGDKYPLEIGVVTLRKSFDRKFRYDGPLGVVFTQKYTEFFIFSPVAKEMFLVVDGNVYEMDYQEPIWYGKVLGNLAGKAYHYQVRLVDTFLEVKDPYTVAANVTDSIIIDPQKLDQQTADYVPLSKYTDAVIYEGHVRDMTIFLDVESKGLFNGLIEKSEKLGTSVLTYIKNLGMTHLQLLPIFDFYGVDEFNKDTLYNWGYNPMQYFSIEGWYSKDPTDPYVRINEVRKLVDEAHKIGLGVIMDVVYNHVYQRALFPYDKLVPGYFYRHDQQFKPTHATFLDNDVETTRYMVRRLIVDSLVHFVKYYKVDGFRFDLMGLMDVDTMNLIEQVLRKINPSIILYGEGWQMDVELPKKMRSNMSNQHLMAQIGHFNDTFRNTLKGPLHSKKLGYASGAKNLNNEVMKVIKGSPHLFNTPNKSINFIECHDNLTFYDTLKLNYEDDSLMKIYQDLGNHLVAISQGVPFYHAGQERYRSKQGVENSYQSSDEINGITWYDENRIHQLKKLLDIRKKYPVYRINTYDDQKVQIKEIDEGILYILKDEKDTLYHYIKNDFNEFKLLKDGTMLFKSQNVSENERHWIIQKPGVYIIRKS